MKPKDRLSCLSSLQGTEQMCWRLALTLGPDRNTVSLLDPHLCVL